VDEIHAHGCHQPFAAMHLPPSPTNGSADDARWGDGLPAFDHVFCLAAFEVEICRCSECARFVAAPDDATGSDAKLEADGRSRWYCWNLDHPPNLEGADCSAPRSRLPVPVKLRLRLVHALARIRCGSCSRYPFVTTSVRWRHRAPLRPRPQRGVLFCTDFLLYRWVAAPKWRQD